MNKLKSSVKSRNILINTFQKITWKNYKKVGPSCYHIFVLHFGMYCIFWHKYYSVQGVCLCACIYIDILTYNFAIWGCDNNVTK